MTYTPKYYTSLDTARSIIKSNIRADLRDSLSDSYLEETVEHAEMYTDHFLVSGGFDVDSLSTRQKADARNMATAHALLYVAGVLPLPPEEKRDYLTQNKERLEEAERSFIKREFPSSQVESQYRRMKPGYGREWFDDETEEFG